MAVLCLLLGGFSFFWAAAAVTSIPQLHLPDPFSHWYRGLLEILAVLTACVGLLALLFRDQSSVVMGSIAGALLNLNGRLGYLIAWLNLIGAGAMLLNATHSDRTGERYWHILPVCLLMSAALFFCGLSRLPLLLVPCFGILVIATPLFKAQFGRFPLHSFTVDPQLRVLPLSIRSAFLEGSSVHTGWA